MEFLIEGADRTTGLDAKTFIIADSERDALLAAKKKGILVSKIEAVKTAAPPVDRLAVTLTGFSAPPPMRQALVPDYKGLKNIASVFLLLAAIWYLLAAVCLVTTFFEIFFLLRTKSPEIQERAIAAATYAIGALVAGIINHGISEFFSGFRDLVRNSFRWH
jgi:hypothetical protein